ncbi:MAG: hypothetical protein WC565_09910 [Parcubacteria group bacterium]|jgi:hypothetical protein
MAEPSVQLSVAVYETRHPRLYQKIKSMKKLERGAMSQWAREVLEHELAKERKEKK